MNQYIADRNPQEASIQIFQIKLEEEDKEESRWIKDLKEKQRQREIELAEKRRQAEEQQRDQQKEKPN